MKRNSRSGREDRSELNVVFEDGLIRDPRILLDPRLLGMLHRELCDRLGSGETDPVLRRAGFFHGLRDAWSLGRTERSGVNLRMALDLEAVEDVCARGSATEFVLRGSFPECLEAEAVLSTLGRRSAPTCSLSLGYASGWLSGLWDRDVLAVEQECAASGGRRCCFTARTVEAWSASAAGHRIEPRLLPFEALRRAVRADLKQTATRRTTAGAFDGSSAAVHVWGPVMVVPYSGQDTAATVDVVAREVATTEIAVVVVDLAGAVVDDGFAAVALERVVKLIQAAGAEAVIAGSSPLSSRVVSNLGQGGLVIRDDLCSAIAAAFQIAEFHRVGH